LCGFDLEVRLVGTRTNGKNVGMEGFVDYDVAGEKYTFMPITFYSENAKGFRDYSDGFVPDVTYDDSNFYPGDFATQDDAYFSIVSRWIESGNKPEIKSGRAATTRSLCIETLPDDIVKPRRHSEGSLVFRE